MTSICFGALRASESIGFIVVLFLLLLLMFLFLLLLLFVLPACLPSAIRLWNSVPATLWCWYSVPATLWCWYSVPATLWCSVSFRLPTICFLLKFFFFRIVPNCFTMMKTLTLLVRHAGLFWCFDNSLNSDIDCRVFNVPVWSFCMCIHAGIRLQRDGCRRRGRPGGTNHDPLPSPP